MTSRSLRLSCTVSPNVLSILRQPTEKTLAIHEIIDTKERCV